MKLSLLYILQKCMQIYSPEVFSASTLSLTFPGLASHFQSVPVWHQNGKNLQYNTSCLKVISNQMSNFEPTFSTFLWKVSNLKNSLATIFNPWRHATTKILKLGFLHTVRVRLRKRCCLETRCVRSRLNNWDWPDRGKHTKTKHKVFTSSYFLFLEDDATISGI